MSFQVETGLYTAFFVFSIIFAANMLGFFELTKTVNIESLDEFRTEKILELEEQIEEQKQEIQKLELMQQPDYSGTIIGIGIMLFALLFVISMFFMSHQEKLKQMEIDAKRVKK